jgi:hypothetical protein
MFLMQTAGGSQRDRYPSFSTRQLPAAFGRLMLTINEKIMGNALIC